MTATGLLISKIFNIRASENRMAALVIGVMLLTSAGSALGSTGAETLFLARFGVQYLPVMTMLLGMLSFATTLGITALMGRFRREVLYVFIPAGLAVTIVIAWAALFSGWRLIYPVLWLGKEIINSLTSLVVWGLAGAACDTRQTKRLFPLFNASRILGGVLGGFLTGILAVVFGTPQLMLAWAATLVVSIGLIRVLINRHIGPQPAEPRSRRKKQPGMIQEMQSGFQFVRGSNLMRWISLAAMLFSVMYFFVFQSFSKAASNQFPGDENSLAGFLGLFYGICTATAFLTSILVANRLYVRIGIMNAILALPLIYLSGFGAQIFSSAFVVIIIFRFAQQLWLAGIADSAWQAVFNTVPANRRDQVRAFVGGVPEQAGTFAAGVVLVIGEQAFTSSQFALLGIAAAAITVFAIWRARLAYFRGLVESLRAGRPAIFNANTRASLPLDAAALQVFIDSMGSPDPIVRRISASMLVRLEIPCAMAALVDALQDDDMEVRLAALAALANPRAAPALLDIAARLADPAPAIRARAVDTLRALGLYPRGLRSLITPLLDDPDSQVRVRAALTLLNLGEQEDARRLLRQMSMSGSLDERILALDALAEAGDPLALTFFETELADSAAPSVIRRASANALGSCGPAAIPALMTALAVEDDLVRAGVASAFGRIGEEALPGLCAALDEPVLEPGALLALEQLPARKAAALLQTYARKRIGTSIHYETLRQSIPAQADDRLALLSESLAARSRLDGIFALRALRLATSNSSSYETLTVAIENLQSRIPEQVSIALESLEAIPEVAIIRPLFGIWEPGQEIKPASGLQQALAQLLNEPDQWLRKCANYAALSKEQDMDTPATFSIMDRVLILRRVPLLAELSPADLQRVAAIATELDFGEGELICAQGENGDEMYVIVTGNVRVVINYERQPEKEIARRTAGDVVGEMSIISNETRMASVIASSDVRVLCLDRLSFESLLRERPEVSLAVMRVLCNRLKQIIE